MVGFCLGGNVLEGHFDDCDDRDHDEDRDDHFDRDHGDDIKGHTLIVMIILIMMMISRVILRKQC